MFSTSICGSEWVYLVRLKFASSVSSERNREFSFVLNGRKVAAEFKASEIAGSDDDLLQYFLVRTSDASITLAPDANSDTSAITEVAIILFDASHGEGLQVISW